MGEGAVQGGVRGGTDRAAVAEEGEGGVREGVEGVQARLAAARREHLQVPPRERERVRK